MTSEAHFLSQLSLLTNKTRLH